MTLTLTVQVGSRTDKQRFTGPVEIGRREGTEPPPFARIERPDAVRWVVADLEEKSVPRRALRVDPQADGGVRITNIAAGSCRLSLPEESMPPGGAVLLRARRTLHFGALVLTIDPAGSVDSAGRHALPEVSIAPGATDRAIPKIDPNEVKRLASWIQTATGVLQNSLCSADFLQAAAEAIVKHVKLDSGRVLLLNDGHWEPAASAGEAVCPVSQSILKSIAQKRKAEWFNESTPQTASDASRAALASWVAAPILAPDGTVRGALYGDRVRDEDSPSHLVTEVDGLLVEMLASGVATGLARQDELSRISGARAQFARFFGAQLAGELDRNPTLLESRRADVTLLFADVRRFSAISEKKPEHVIDWLRDVMNLMTSKIQGRGGVLLDFVGDEAIAIWNAPRAQDDHCALAVAAALDILEAMPDLNARWFERLGTRTEVGIGVNHGPAMVGNIGSDDRLKYGALGRNVNLASRLQGLTKYLKVKLLISQSVRDQLLGNDRFIIRRVCKTRVVNMDEPVDVYEVDRLDAPGSERRAQLFKASETALALFEGKDWAAAAEQASEKLRDFRKDGPLLLTLSRAVEMLRDETRDFDPAWEPPGK